MVAVQEQPKVFIRPDGKEKVTGLGRYTADFNLTGQLHAKFKYAAHAHARITRIDTSKAKALPGVMAVLTHEDVPDVKYGGMVQDRRMFAKDKVRWEGDVVAAVAAMTADIAAQAVALIEVDYEPLPVVTDYEHAHESSTLVHDDWESDSGDDSMGRDGNTLGFTHLVRGDAAAAMARADKVVRSRYVADGSQGAPIEPRAIIAQWQGDKVTVWSSTQVPFSAKGGVATVLGIPETQVRIIVPLLGGGFGAKCDFHFEGHIAALAKAAGRPVKLVFSRREEFIAPDHRREGVTAEFETGVMNDGTIVARRAKVFLDAGAYCGEGGFFAAMAAMHALGPYKIQNVDVESRLNYSNNQPSSSIRAPTAPQTCWALEQHIDEVAAAINMDPVEFRRRTLIEEGQEGPMGQVYRGIGIKQALEKAVEMIGYGQQLPDDEAIGVACGWWPSFAAPAGAYVKLNRDGTGTIITGAQECGTGAVMGLPILAADVLGMQPEDFSLVYQDTDAGPWDMGASGSQTTFNNGRAVVSAATEVREQILNAAAAELEVSKDDLELVEGAARVKGSPDKAVTIASLAGSGTQYLGKGSGDMPEPTPADGSQCVGSLGMESWLAPQLITHAARVKVDKSTGVTRVLHFAAAHDSGKIVNRIGADGQVYGGVLMGLGQALSESSMYGEDGHQKNPALLDYKLQTAADAPKIDIYWVDVPTPEGGPKGAKGVGEPPSVPTSGAVGNALAKVVGKHISQLPMTPERVWATIQEGN